MSFRSKAQDRKGGSTRLCSALSLTDTSRQRVKALAWITIKHNAREGMQPFRLELRIDREGLDRSLGLIKFVEDRTNNIHDKIAKVVTRLGELLCITKSHNEWTSCGVTPAPGLVSISCTPAAGLNASARLFLSVLCNCIHHCSKYRSIRSERFIEITNHS